MLISPWEPYVFQTKIYILNLSTLPIGVHKYQLVHCIFWILYVFDVTFSSYYCSEDQFAVVSFVLFFSSWWAQGCEIVLLFLFHIFYSFGSEQLIIYFMTSQICILDSPKENTHTVHSNKAWNAILFRIQLFN